MDRAEVVTELQRSWVRKLYAWWRHYNEDYLDGALVLPLIELGGEGGEGAVLGSWDTQPTGVCALPQAISPPIRGCR